VRRLVGKGGDNQVPHVTGRPPDHPRAPAVRERRSPIFRARYLPRARALPGARALVACMRARGLALAVATSAEAAEVDGLLGRAGVRDLVGARTSASDVERSKPEPDVVAAALELLGLPPSAVILIGDTPYDVEAAARTGVGVIALRSGGWSDADLTGAVGIYDDPADLLVHYDASPLERPEGVAVPPPV
jgi:HAD superfamily hydrolase (TIGR01509 family)